MNVGLIHYSYCPVVGGVEFVMQGQARAFARNGHKVRVICKNRLAPSLEKNISAHLLPAHGKNLEQALRRMVQGLDMILVHNVMSMPFDLALTAAIWELAAETGEQIRWIFWTHDLCLLNPDYPRYDTRRFPFSLLKTRHPSARYVAISDLRRRELCGLLKIPRSSVRVVPDGIDVPALLDLDADVWSFFLKEKLQEHDHVLFLPARILPRKNLEAAIRIAAGLKSMKLRVKLLMTGAPDPHNSSAINYFRKVRALIRKLKLQREVTFVNDHFPVRFRQLLSLYRLCDAVLMTSHQEGFGLPLLEAGIHSKPVICPRRPPFTEIVAGRAIYLAGNHGDARKISRALNGSPTVTHFKRVLREYSWEAVWEKHLRRLLPSRPLRARLK